VIDLTSFSKATIYRKVADGTFPRPLKIRKSRVAWRESDIVAWIAGLAK
jgi:prophage regulatory protein